MGKHHTTAKNQGYAPAELAQMSGVSVRTLHHYDQIGLLVPARGDNGYRRYSQADVARLQQILLFRACGLELAQIRQALDAPGFDPEQALLGHLSELRRRRHSLDTLIATVERTVADLRGEEVMSDSERFEGLKRSAVEDNERRYGAEVRRRWGDETADAANNLLLAMDEEAWNDMNALEEAIKEQLKAAMATKDPAGEAAAELVRMHARWLELHWPKGTYTPEAHRGMGQMYVADDRFRSYYDDACGEGAAQFLCDAIAACTR